MAAAMRQLTCDARVVMMRVDSDAKRGGRRSGIVHGPKQESARIPFTVRLGGKVRSVPNSVSCLDKVSARRESTLYSRVYGSSPDFAALRSTITTCISRPFKRLSTPVIGVMATRTAGAKDSKQAFQSGEHWLFARTIGFLGYAHVTCYLLDM